MEAVYNTGSQEENFHNTHFELQKKFKLSSSAHCVDTVRQIHPDKKYTRGRTSNPRKSQVSKDVKPFNFFCKLLATFSKDLIRTYNSGKAEVCKQTHI